MIDQNHKHTTMYFQMGGMQEIKFSSGVDQFQVKP